MTVNTYKTIFGGIACPLCEIKFWKIENDKFVSIQPNEEERKFARSSYQRAMAAMDGWMPMGIRKISANLYASIELVLPEITRAEIPQGV